MRRNSIEPPHSVREQLKKKGRARRESAVQVASAVRIARPQRNDLLPALSVVQVAVDELKSPARRLRKSDPAHIREIANAISTLGFNLPLLIGQNNEVVDGNSRLEAARLLGLLHVPCIVLDHLDANEQRLLRLAVNRLAEKGIWNFDELKAEFDELIIESAPIEITGFGTDEIDQIVIGDERQFDEVGDLEPKPEAVPISRDGDVWLLGDHRLICGDATDPNVLTRLMQGDAARLVFTDEPFNVAIAGHVTGGDHREFVMASGEMSDEQFLNFNCRWLDALLPHVVNGGLVATFIDWRGLPIVHAAATRLGLVPINLVVWAKTNAGLGSLYRSQHELLPLFKKGTIPHVNNVVLGKRGRWRSNVWTYPGASSLGSDARQGLKEHPTVKPTAMLKDALVDLSDRAEFILDPFCGSGSTLIACEETGRLCRAIELDPLYVDVAIRRYRSLTNKEAILEGTRLTFDCIEKERL